MNIGGPLILTKGNRLASVAGDKTNTRRVIVPQPNIFAPGESTEVGDVWYDPIAKKVFKATVSTGRNKRDAGILTPKEIKPRYSVGEIVYMPEPYRVCNIDLDKEHSLMVYYCDDRSYHSVKVTKREMYLWQHRKYPTDKTSARGMYKSLARHFFEITAIRVERLQDISEADAKAEGCKPEDVHCPDLMGSGSWKDIPLYKAGFKTLWNSIWEEPKPVKNKDGVIIYYKSFPWDDTGKWAKLTTFRGKPHYCTPNPWDFAYTYRKVEI